jgi:hypothetical protein
VLFRSEHSRVQLAGSGGLAIIWMSSAAWLRAHHLIRTYAVIPSPLRMDHMGWQPASFTRGGVRRPSEPTTKAAD